MMAIMAADDEVDDDVDLVDEVDEKCTYHMGAATFVLINETTKYANEENLELLICSPLIHSSRFIAARELMGSEIMNILYSLIDVYNDRITWMDTTSLKSKGVDHDEEAYKLCDTHLVDYKFDARDVATSYYRRNQSFMAPESSNHPRTLESMDWRYKRTDSFIWHLRKHSALGTPKREKYILYDIVEEGPTAFLKLRQSLVVLKLMQFANSMANAINGVPWDIVRTIERGGLSSYDYTEPFSFCMLCLYVYTYVHTFYLFIYKPDNHETAHTEEKQLQWNDEMARGSLCTEELEGKEWMNEDDVKKMLEKEYGTPLDTAAKLNDRIRKLWAHQALVRLASSASCMGPFDPTSLMETCEYGVGSWDLVQEFKWGCIENEADGMIIMSKLPKIWPTKGMSFWTSFSVEYVDEIRRCRALKELMRVSYNSKYFVAPALFKQLVKAFGHSELDDEYWKTWGNIAAYHGNLYLEMQRSMVLKANSSKTAKSSTKSIMEFAWQLFQTWFMEKYLWKYMGRRIEALRAMTSAKISLAASNLLWAPYELDWLNVKDRANNLHMLAVLKIYKELVVMERKVALRLHLLQEDRQPVREIEKRLKREYPWIEGMWDGLSFKQLRASVKECCDVEKFLVGTDSD